MSKLDELSTKLQSMLNDERAQIDRRLNWLSAFQGLLFVALGFAWDKDKLIVSVLALLGISIAFLVLIGLYAATLAIEKIRITWEKNKPANYDGPDVMGFYPYKAHFLVYTSPEHFIALAFIVAWTIVLFIR